MKPLTLYIAASKGVGKPFVGWAFLLCDGGTGNRLRMISDGLVNSDLGTGLMKALVEGLKTINRPTRLHVMTTHKLVFDMLKDNGFGLREWEVKDFEGSPRPGLWRIVFEHMLRHEVTVSLMEDEKSSGVMHECFLVAKRERRELSGAPARVKEKFKKFKGQKNDR